MGEVCAGGQAAWLKRETQEGFLEEVVVEWAISEWRVREDIRHKEMAGKGPKEGKWRPCLESPWCSQQHLLLPSIQGILRMAVRTEGAVQTKRTHRGHDWAQSPPAALGNLSSHPSKFCLQLRGQAQPSPAWPRQSLCFYLGVFPGTTQICLK